jgi:membrane associated rhomboid family serine protease
MRHPPPLKTCLRYPITTSVAAFSIMATYQYLVGGADISKLMIGLDGWWRDPWRFLTPVLFHGGPLHLIFNLCWLWIFGTQIETEFGQAKTLGIYALLAAGSCAAERAILGECIGLSGVVYGQFGLLWMLSRTDPRFRDSVDRQTVQWMVGWFLFCIVTTVTNIMPVANIAHGMGCVLGMLLGWAISARSQLLRIRNSAVLAAVFLLCIAGGTVARPYVNLSRDPFSLADLGYTALSIGDSNRAIVLYRKAVTLKPSVPEWWHNLGVAYHRAGRDDEALEALKREILLKADRK